ncbi:hypothetical protein GGR51DRAFT_551747 [Nemania sp. FL0031]|nr:hypothetical protein GGR51DRAFT_551747 [Nemania sp. FL0031]
MATQTTDSSRNGLALVHVALYRMGTGSMAEAYRILGYQAHHVHDDNVLGQPWQLIEKAAEATWPNVGATPRPVFKREDWEKLWDPKYDVVTDLVAPFADQLALLYPEAKVVIVQRDFESWWPSYKSECLDTIFAPVPQIVTFALWHVLGIRAGYAMRKVHLGFFNAKSQAEIESKAREGYNRYFDKVRQTVPPERRLEYKLGDGWQPLCAFLGKDVPDIPFPRLNDRKVHSESTAKSSRKVLVDSALKIAPLLMAVVTVVFASFFYAMS